MSSSEFKHQDSADTSTPEAQALGYAEDAGLLAHQQKNARILWAIFAMLLLIAAGVFFVLPRLVSPPDLSASNPQPATSATQAETQPSTEADLLPFQDAQRMRQRSAAQESLSALLELQEALQEKAVEQWASADYNQSLELASSGDEAYREQDFNRANEDYTEALTILETLQESLPSVVADLLEQGLQAIENADSNAAIATFELVMAIEPGSTDADTGLQRALTLDEVLNHLNTGLELEQAGELEAARDQYEQALALDAEHQASQGALDAVKQAIVERDFTQHMSQGYAALSNNDADAAEGHFRQALTVKPGSAEAQTALEQVRDQISTQAISGHLSRAAEQERQENWQAALAAYEDALGVDANIVQAKDGRDRARSRLNLDNYLQEILADPLQLADPVTYERSVEIYTSALNIPDGGPRLREQMQQARHYLEDVKRPRTVTLRSDSATSVTILRIDTLGQFTDTNVQLTPGRYVATGARQGYRDVRVEFVVPFDGAPEPVDVICTQRI